MSNFSSEDRAAQGLHSGLLAQPAPLISSDFDNRVLAALRIPQPWWQRLWEPMRPVVVSAAGSLVVTLFLLHWSLTLPVVSIPIGPVPVASNSTAIPNLDALLDRPNLYASSLGYGYDWMVPEPPPTPAAPPPSPLPPRRHADADSGPSLLA